MKLQEFINYSEKEQLQYLCYQGVCVADREENETLMLLYQISDFYVEVHHEMRGFHIQKLVCFEADDELDIYLEKINTSNFLKAAV